jgi:hypothetical protein
MHRGEAVTSTNNTGSPRSASVRVCRRFWDARRLILPDGPAPVLFPQADAQPERRRCDII